MRKAFHENNEGVSDLSFEICSLFVEQMYFCEEDMLVSSGSFFCRGVVSKSIIFVELGKKKLVHYYKNEVVFQFK